MGACEKVWEQIKKKIMKNDRQPSHQDWKALYSAAIEFKKAAPWDWMHDSAEDSKVGAKRDMGSGFLSCACACMGNGEKTILSVYEFGG